VAGIAHLLGKKQAAMKRFLTRLVTVVVLAASIFGCERPAMTGTERRSANTEGKEKVTKAILDVIFLDEKGDWISHKWAAYVGAQQPNDPPADHDWKEYSGQVKIPEGTKKIQVGLQIYGPGKVWFDDVRAEYVK
jgi:hypothetical protein